MTNQKEHIPAAYTFFVHLAHDNEILDLALVSGKILQAIMATDMVLRPTDFAGKGLNKCDQYA